jgi:hypothetical protein
MGYRASSTRSRILMGLAVCAAIAALGFAFIVAGEAFAQQKAGPKEAAQTKPVAPPQPAYQMSTEQAAYLVRSTFATVNDANRSGNYSVLHNLATPDFQATNNPADLALAFVNLRRGNLDLFKLSFVPPEFTAAPAVDAKGTLRVIGYFPAAPRQINFELLYQVVNGQWRIAGIAIAMPDAAPAAQQPSATYVSSALGIAPASDSGSKPTADATASKP